MALGDGYLRYEKMKIADYTDPCSTDYRDRVEEFKTLFSVTEVAVKLALFNYVTFSDEYDQQVKMEYENAINSSFSLEDHWTQQT